MKTIVKIVTLLFLMLPLIAFPQDAEMADAFRTEGKIYVVIAVICIILAGLISYLFILGRRISKMERKVNESK